MNGEEPQNIYTQRHQEFFKPLPQAVAELRGVFEKFDLNQTQAACVAACALNQMTRADSGFPQFATVSLSPALQLKN